MKEKMWEIHSGERNALPGPAPNTQSDVHPVSSVPFNHPS